MRRLARAGAAAAVCALAAGPGWAVSSLNFTATAEKEGCAVRVNGAPLLTLRGPGYRAQAARIAGQLQAAAERGGPDEVTVGRARGVPAVMLDGKVLVRVEGRIAAGNNSTPQGLAEVWRRRVFEVFAQPFVTVARDSIDVPLGESRLVPVLGSLAAGVVVSADPKVLRGDFDPKQRAVRLWGVGRGRTELVLTSGLASLAVKARVAPWAGAVAAQVEAVVTGRLVPQEVVAKAATFAAYQATRAEWGATVSVAEPRVATGALAQGQATKASVEVNVTGEQYLPVKAVMTAVVRARPLTLPEAGQLMVSNQPERLPSLGQWYEGRLPADSASRLLYHHVNGTGGAADLVVEVVNPQTVPARVHVVEGLAGPSYDEIFVGHAAARTFLKRMARRVGYIVTVPRSGRVTLARHRLRPGAIASGIIEVSVLQSGPSTGSGSPRPALAGSPPAKSRGGDLVVRVRLLPVGARPLVGGVEGTPQLPARPLWVFPNPRKTLTAEYKVGGNWAFVSVGREAVSGMNHGEALPGNYGILYDITFQIDNPSDEVAKLEFAFQTAAGAARAVVLINGVVYQTGLVGANGDETLARFRVPARTRRRVLVQTMPQSGSNYPVRLVCRPAGSGE